MLATVGGVLGGISYFTTWSQQERSVKAGEDSGKADTADNARAEQEEREKKDRAEGPPIRSTPGSPDYLASRFAFPSRTTDLGDGAHSRYGDEQYANWFATNNGEEVGISVYRVTIAGLHEGTMVVQNMRLSDVRCTPTKYTGTAVVPNPIGDGGEGAEAVDVAFDLSAATPKPREIMGRSEAGATSGNEVWKLGGSAFHEAIYLEGGEKFDARAFDLYFFTGTNDCTFGVEVNVTSENKDDWYPIKLSGKLGKPDGRGSVAGQTERYESVVAPSEDALGNELRGPGNPFTAVEVKKSGF